MADRQLAKKGKSGVDNTFRRTWDTDDYAQRAAKREKEVIVTSRHVVLLLKHIEPLMLIQIDTLQEKDIEESALDAKKRRRLGTAYLCLLHSVIQPST